MTAWPTLPHCTLGSSQQMKAADAPRATSSAASRRSSSQPSAMRAHVTSAMSRAATCGSMPDVEPIDEGFATALCVVAHPDDLEYGVASVVARWTAMGKEVSYVLATRGEAGIQGRSPDEVGPLREAEERASARVVGVDDVVFL